MPIINSIAEIRLLPKPTTHLFQDIEGQRFGRLVPFGFAGSQQGFAQWYCQCDCGNIVLIKAAPLRSGNTKSCGCLWREHKSNLRHGMCATKEYKTFIAAKERCTRPQNDHYPAYGGRGIEFRFSTFQEFLNEIGNCPSPQHSIDRIDVNGHYEKGNVRWANNRTQSRNRTDNIILTHNGESLCQADWAKRMGTNSRVLCLRRQRGWCVECTVTLPLGGRCTHRNT